MWNKTYLINKFEPSNHGNDIRINLYGAYVPENKDNKGRDQSLIKQTAYLHVNTPLTTKTAEITFVVSSINIFIVACVTSLK